MSFLFLGLALLLAVYFVVSTGLSLLVAALLPALGPHFAKSDPARRARVLFALGMLPAASGLAVALGLALPAWLVHEPRGTGEHAGLLLLVLAGAGATLFLHRLGGAVHDLVRTRRLVRRWTSEGRELHGLPLPATRFTHDFPVAGLSGLLRPRLLVTDALLDALEEDELAAVVAHEYAHASARDNLRQLCLRGSVDLLAFTPAGARLRAAFEEATESAADRAAGERTAPLALARALLKVAALVPADRRLDAGLAALHRQGSLAARVRALAVASDEVAPRIPPAVGRSQSRHIVVLALIACAPLLASAAVALLPSVHRLLEGLVHAFA